MADLAITPCPAEQVGMACACRDAGITTGGATCDFDWRSRSLNETPADPTFLGVVNREWLGGADGWMRGMNDPALAPLKTSGEPVLLLYPAGDAPRGLVLEAAWLIDRWSERGWQHRSARWADPVGWMPLPPIPTKEPAS